MEDVCAPCVEQTSVVGVDGTTYSLEKLCCPEGAVWIKFGLSDQGDLWTHFREMFAENEYEVSHIQDYLTVSQMDVAHRITTVPLLEHYKPTML